jgi:hypothetical protein
MNMHPFLGHFPVSILLMYALIELFGNRSIRESDYWFRVRALLAITGTALAYLTLPTGGLTKAIVLKARPDLADLIATFTTFSWMAIFVFTILAAAYAIRLASLYKYDTTPFFQKPEVIRLWKPITKAADAILRPLPSRTLSLLGIILIVIAANLGISIVYGADIDPLVGYIYNTFKGLFY